MIFRVTATSGHMDATVEIASLDELLQWAERQNAPVIVSRDEVTWPELGWRLEIYDDYRE